MLCQILDQEVLHKHNKQVWVSLPDKDKQKELPLKVWVDLLDQDWEQNKDYLIDLLLAHNQD